MPKVHPFSFVQCSCWWMLNHHHQPCIRGCWRYQCWCHQILRKALAFARAWMSIPDRSRNPQAGGGGLPWITNGSFVTTWLGEVWGAASLLERGFLQPQADGMHTDSMWFVGFKRWQCCCNFQAIGDFRIFTDISGSINESRQFMTYGELHVISWSTVQTQRFFTWPMDFDPFEILRGASWHVTTSQTRMAIAAETPGVLTSWFPWTTNNLRLETRKHVDWVY